MNHPLIPALVAWFCATMLGLVPPFSRDGLNSHLLLPSLWAEHGWFWRDAWLSFTANPPLGDFPYLLVAGCGWDVVASVFHAVGALVSLLLLRNSLQYLNCLPSTQRLMLLLWVTIPTVTVLCTWSYVDLWLCAATAACVLLITKPALHYSDGWWLGFAFAVALLTKYNGGAVIVAAILAMAWRTADRPALLFAIMWRAGLLVLPAFIWWYGGNFFALGNALYPLGEGGGHVHWITYRQLGYQEPFWWALLAPLRVFVWGETNNPVLFDGMLSPLLLLGLFIGWRLRDRISSALLIGAFIYLLFTFSTGVRARYMLPVTLFLIPLTAVVLERCLRLRLRLWVIAIAIALALFNSGYYVSWLSSWTYWFQGRDAFLNAKLSHYPIEHWISEHTPKDARIFLLWMGGRAYYLHRPFSYRMGREDQPLSEDLAREFDYLLLNTRVKRDILDAQGWSQMRSISCLVASSPPYELWRLLPCKAMHR